MRCRDLEPPSVVVAGIPVDGVVTTVGSLGGHDLTIATSVALLGLDVQSSTLGAADGKTGTVHLVRSRAGSQISFDETDEGGLFDRTSRSKCLLDHYVRVKEALERIADAEVHIEIADHALDLVLL